MGIQLIGNKGFFDVVVYTYFVAFPHIFRGSQGGSEYDWSIAVCFTDAFHHLETIHDRHVDIRNDNIRMMLLPGLQTFHAVACGYDFVSSDDIL